MNVQRMWAMIKIIVQGHILNWPWRSRQHRSMVRSDVISRIIPKYFERYLPAAAAVVERKVENNDKNDKKNALHSAEYAVSLNEKNFQAKLLISKINATK